MTCAPGPTAGVGWIGGGPPSADNYLGVVAQVSDDWRIVVSPRCDAYWLQNRARGPDGGALWVLPNGRPSVTLDRWLARFGASVPGLGEAAAGLPADPAEASAAHTEARQAFLAAHEVNKMTAPGYGRVIREETQLRLIVDRDGLRYSVQWISEADYLAGRAVPWKWIATAWRLEPLRRKIARDAFDPALATSMFYQDGEGRDRVAWYRLPSREGAWLDRVHGFFEDFPEKASDGVWPVLPALPSGFRPAGVSRKSEG